MTTEERIERIWVTPGGAVFHEKPLRQVPATEYVRVLTPYEWERRAQSVEGIDINQHMARLHDKLEAQKREITRLHAEVQRLKTPEAAHVQ